MNIGFTAVSKIRSNFAASIQMINNQNHRKEVFKATDYGTIIDLIIDILVIVRDGLDSSKD